MTILDSINKDGEFFVKIAADDKDCWINITNMNISKAVEYLELRDELIESSMPTFEYSLTRVN
jgi:hypothetical protein